MTEDARRRWLRIGLIYLAVQPALLAAWILTAPRSFYDDFPGAGLHWVDPLGPYNEHLLRDFGAANLGFLVMLVLAAVWLDRRVVQVVLIGYAAAGLPHLVYHVTTVDEFDFIDNFLSLGALFLAVALPLGMLTLTREKEAAWHASGQ
jgi:hypothetical protein